jgi:hypothetical protein
MVSRRNGARTVHSISATNFQTIDPEDVAKVEYAVTYALTRRCSPWRSPNPGASTCLLPVCRYALSSRAQMHGGNLVD